eukprot:comp11854_c0_seq1/m.6484 comp11854_c0_seq1/g.6484  ORF comp11854_c0_seq1/g.6484 comp11854_c0_seq1/m.6484 type:complete len:402 (-) comp11854_c0_seq1:476-1681(-)
MPKTLPNPEMQLENPYQGSRASFEQQFAAQAISTLERLQSMSSNMGSSESHMYSYRGLSNMSPPSSPEMKAHHHHHQRSLKVWSASMPSTACHSEDEHGQDDCHSDCSNSCNSDNEGENVRQTQSRCTSPTFSLDQKSDNRGSEKAQRKRPCLRQYKCVYPGCSSWRTNKRNNMERHVWTQHVRTHIDSSDVPYIARLHKHFVAKHLVPVTPAIRGVGRAKTPKSECKSSGMPRSSRLSSQPELSILHDYSAPLVATGSGLTEPLSSRSWPVSPEHHAAAELGRVEEEQPMCQYAFANPYSGVHTPPQSAWQRRGFLNVHESVSQSTSYTGSPQSPFNSFNIRIDSPVPLYAHRESGTSSTQRSPLSEFIAGSHDVPIDQSQVYGDNETMHGTDNVWRPWA